MSKSLFEFVSEAIDEVLPKDSGTTGREVYLRGWQRYQQLHFLREMAQRRKELEKSFPLLAPASDDVVSW